MLFHSKRNLKKSINLTGQSAHADGAFCNYFKYNEEEGIKVLYSDGHKTIQSLRNSNVWRRATKEHKLLVKCKERYHNIPGSFGVFPIKIGKYYYPGIVMQHIPGKMLHMHPSYDSDRKHEIILLLHKELKKVGIHHDDLHGGNILVDDCDVGVVYWIIDFTYDLIVLDDGYNR